MKLSILIPTIPDRQEMFLSLVKQLYHQLEKISGDIVYNGRVTEIEVLCNYSAPNEMNIGEKRNKLLAIAQGKYICFIDDDDSISENYISLLMDGIENNPDCLSLRGIITENGVNPSIFEHSIKYKAYATTENEIKYERYPNHLNCIRAEIAKQFKFPEINHGEDTDWATQIFKSGLIKTEHYIDEVLYYYKFISNKKYV